MFNSGRSSESYEGVAIGLGFVIGFFVGAVMVFVIDGHCLEDLKTKWRVDAVEHGFAEYDAKTGEWKWKESVDVQQNEAQ